MNQLRNVILRILCALCFLAFVPISANAISLSSIANTSCSGNLTSSLQDGASFACAGNLTLDGGFVTSDSLISISADGDLFVDNLTFNAPNVTLSSLSGLMTLNSSVVLNSDLFTLTGDVKVNQGVLINITARSNINVGNSAEYPLSSNLLLNAGITISAGAGGNLYYGGGGGYNLNPRTDLPVFAGTLVLGSGGLLINTGGNPYGLDITIASVPEPSTHSMMFIGLLGLIGFSRVGRKST